MSSMRAEAGRQVSSGAVWKEAAIFPGADDAAYQNARREHGSKAGPRSAAILMSELNVSHNFSLPLPQKL